MTYAVIKTGGKQYRVAEGDIIEVDKLDKKAGDKIVFPEVLLLVNEGNIQIGQPVVNGTDVTAKVLDQTKGDKIHVFKFKSKVRYRRHTGFRAKLTKVQIEKIGSEKEKKETEAEKTPEPSRKKRVSKNA